MITPTTTTTTTMLMIMLMSMITNPGTATRMALPTATDYWSASPANSCVLR
jgi:hypothetical protein